MSTQDSKKFKKFSRAREWWRNHVPGRRAVSPPTPSTGMSNPHTRPSNPVAANARAIRAGTDGGANDAQQLAAASLLEKSSKPPANNTQEPATTSPVEKSSEPPDEHGTEEPTVPPQTHAEANPGVEESQPASASKAQPDADLTQKLWDDAYDKLEAEAETEGLVKAYRDTLAEVLVNERLGDHKAKNSASAKAERKNLKDRILEELRDRSQRQAHLNRLVKDGREKFSKPAKLIDGLDAFAQAVLSIKPGVDLALQIPQAAPAALPWAGVCIGLQILSNPAKARKSNLTGIVHVSQRMEWYCSLTPRLLDQKGIKMGDESESFEPVRLQLQSKVVELYKAILFYQMKSVCSYYKHQGLAFLQDLANWNDWDGYLEQVKDAEKTLKDDTAQAREVDSNLALNGLATKANNIHEAIQYQIRQRKAMSEAKMDRKYFEDLKVSYPDLDMDEIEKDKGGLRGDVYGWVLDSEQYAAFTNWEDNGKSDVASCPLLWVKGHPGMGKTMLLIGIIHELGDGVVHYAPSLCYFFCQSTKEKDTNSPTTILRSLVWMLLLQQPNLIKHVRSAHTERQDDSLFSDKKYAWQLASRIFEDITKDPQLRPVYFIIDALDECSEDVTNLIALISRSFNHPERMRWLISSRPHTNVLTRLKEYRTESMDKTKSVLDLQFCDLAGPVAAYIDYNLSTLQRTPGPPGYNEVILKDISNEIRNRASTTFLWVSLVFKELNRRNTYDGTWVVDGSEALLIVQQMPSGLPEIYDHMMGMIERRLQQLNEPRRTKEQERYKAILAALTLASRSLSLPELRVLVNDLDVKTVAENCGSFLVINAETVSLIHLSAKDYLEENYESRLQSAGVAQGHADIVKRSFDAMKILERNIYGLNSWGIELKDISQPKPNPLDPIRYCCVFWLDHLHDGIRKNGENSKGICDDAFKFLKQHFLHWLESLSLLGKLSDGVRSIRRLLDAVQQRPAASHQLLEFLKDAEKFILSHGSIIERSPLQAYGSALVFSPTMSEIRNKQWEERLPFIRNVNGIRDRWSAHQQTLEGHSKSVNSVAFSPDGKTLASASGDKTVRLWDTATGAYQRSLEGHSSWVRLVAFSPDGKTLASALHDTTVWLWDTATGAYQRSLKGHSSSVTSVAFSPDGKTLASASDDKTVQLWDTATGAHWRSLEGHSRSVNSVAFSPDGKTLASASGDKTVRLWDTATGAYQRSLEGHSSLVTSVAFSLNGKMLASASGDKTVRLWDTATGAHQQSLEGHSRLVYSVAFSLDGKTLASASGDKTVRLWDTATGAHQQSLEGHSSSVNSVTFSPDGKTLASASDDVTVRLWDTAMGAHQRSLEGHSSSVNLVAFSPDGKTLASACDTTVRLWDTATGAYYRSLEGYSSSVNLVAFSPDGNTLALACDTTVRLWDTATGAHHRSLEGYSSSVYLVAFSPDGKTLASASHDKTVQLWDTATGAHQRSLEGYSSLVTSVAFSLNGKMLASASHNKTVQVWDTATGAHQWSLQGHSRSVYSVAFSPDGKTLASASGDMTVRLWDTATGAHQRSLEGHSRLVNSIAFSPDGKTLASACDTTVRLWDAATGAHHRSLDVDVAISQLSFSGDGTCLHTNRGVLDITCATASPVSTTPPLFVREQWIVCGSETLLWLPRDYRATTVAVFRDTVALGHASGGVSIMELIVKTEPPPHPHPQV